MCLGVERESLGREYDANRRASWQGTSATPQYAVGIETTAVVGMVCGTFGKRND